MRLCQVPDYFFVLLNILKVGGRDGCLFTKNTLTNATKFKNMHNPNPNPNPNPQQLVNLSLRLHQKYIYIYIFFFFFGGGGGLLS